MRREAREEVGRLKRVLSSEAAAVLRQLVAVPTSRQAPQLSQDLVALEVAVHRLRAVLRCEGVKV